MSSGAEVDELINKLKPLSIDLVVGGPPCQPFSRAGSAKIASLVRSGTRNEVDSRRELWRSFVQVVLELRPRAVLLENVPDMALGDDLGIVRELAHELESCGYDVDYRLLDAWKYGVPQHRKRFILQARRDHVSITWPSDDLTKPSVRDAIADLPALEGGVGSRELEYVPAARMSALASRLRAGSASNVVYDHVTRPVRDDDREAFRLMTHKTSYRDLPEYLKRYRDDSFSDKYKRLDWSDLSRTITAHIARDGYWYIHPEEHRTITIREAARLQTFPDSFRFAGSRSDAFRQIGNAVPPMLGQAVAESLRASTETSTSVAPFSLGVIRAALSRWAMIEREERWWRFPGPLMGETMAALSVLLDLHLASDFVGKSVGNLVLPSTELSIELLERVHNLAPTVAKKRRVAHLSTWWLAQHQSLGGRIPLESFFGEADRRRFQLLMGNDVLILNARVAQRVCELLDVPADLMGLKTDVKVALARLVGVGSTSALRMSALSVMTREDLASTMGRQG